MLPDNQLLDRYCSEQAEADFEELVRRHATLVYGIALRQLNGDADLARDVAQMVFADLARKARSLQGHRSLAGWLYTSARFASAKMARSEQRRQIRELAVSDTVNSHAAPPSSIDPERLRPLIDHAMEELAEEDREAVLLRFFEARDYQSLGSCLGLSQDAARKRVHRAVQKLRTVLQRKGISSSEAALETALGLAAAVVIPGDLHGSILKSVAGAAIQDSAPAASSLAPIGNMKTILLLTGLTVGLATVTLVQRGAAARLRSENTTLAAKVAALTTAIADSKVLGREATPQSELEKLRRERSELLQLRDEVTRLRAAQRQRAASPPPPSEEERLLATTQVSVETKFLEAPASTLNKLSMETIGLNIMGVGVTAILTTSQLKTLLDAVQAEPGVRVLSAPRVTTLHQRAASIDVVSIQGAGASHAALGPSADVLPVVLLDRRSISLDATVGLAEQVPAIEGADPNSSRTWQTKVSGKGVLWDGQTMVLSQHIGGLDSGSPPREDGQNSLVVLMTPYLIDPAGNRIHPESGTSWAQ